MTAFRAAALAVPLAAALGLAAPAAAATLDFSFSFENNPAYGGGIVTGIVRGLQDNAISAATSVEVLGNTSTLGAFGLGEYVPSIFDGLATTFNTWTLVDGVITEALFFVTGTTNANAVALGADPSVVTDASLQLQITGSQTFAGLSNDPVQVNAQNAGPLSFTRVEPPAPVPLPAAAWLLLTAVALLAGLRRWRFATA